MVAIGTYTSMLYVTTGNNPNLNKILSKAVSRQFI